MLGNKPIKQVCEFKYEGNLTSPDGERDLENKRSTFMYRNGMIYRHFRAGIPNLF
jgi:hypothetical protein